MEKRAKGVPSRKRRGEPSGDPDRFRSPKHQERYQNIVRGKKFNPERAFDLSSGEFTIITSTLRELGWTTLNATIKRANQSIVREFYSNAYWEDDQDRSTTVYVRGREVSYSPDSINSLLGLPTTEDCAMMDAWDSRREFDFEGLLRELCRPGASWEKFPFLGPHSIPRRFCNMALKPIPKAWNAFFNQSIISCSNSTDVKTKVAMGLRAIMRGHRVNVGKAISESLAEIIKCNRARLGHASLIHALCKQQGCPEYPDDLLIDAREPITAAWIMKQPEGPMQGAAPQQPPPPPQQQPAAQPDFQQYYGDPSFQFELMMANWCGMSALSLQQGQDISYMATPRVADAAQQFLAQRRGAAGPSSSSAPAGPQDAHQDDPLLSGDEYLEDIDFH